MAVHGEKRGFTLIELLIVVVVIATLMGLVFRLAGVGSDQKARNTTITRLQKLEFALSGYFAAFGSYPPVPLHGSRDIFCDVNAYGVQLPSGDNPSTKLEWRRVRAACLAQPLAVEYPYNANNAYVKDMMPLLGQSIVGSSSIDLLENPGMLPTRSQLARMGSSDAPLTMWQKVQVFKFGALSFLLPRYLFMVAGPEELYDGGTYSAPWQAQNDLKTLFNFRTGRPLYSKWEDLQRDTGQNANNTPVNLEEKQEYKRVMMQSSQAVCARWMEAFDGIIDGGRVFFGVNTQRNHDSNAGYLTNIDPAELGRSAAVLPVYQASANGPQSGRGSGMVYALDGMSVRDGWQEEIFYYSPPPYQSYRLWSAGPNKKTIPPWVELENLSNKGGGGLATAMKWVADDIVGLSAPSN